MKMPLLSSKKELEIYLRKNPLLVEATERINQSLLVCKGNKLKRLEYLVEINIGYLNVLSDVIVELKKEYKIKEE